MRETEITILKIIVIFLIAVLVVLFSYAFAIAAPLQKSSCKTLEEVKQYLSGTWQEKSIGAGLSVDGNMYEILAADDGGSWTILQVTPDNIACAMTAGDFWLPPVIRPPKHNIGKF